MKTLRWREAAISFAAGGYFGAGLLALIEGDWYHVIIRLPVATLAICACYSYVKENCK